MKITDYMHNAMTILSGEFAARHRMGMRNFKDLGLYWDDTIACSDGYRGKYVNRPIVTLGVTVEDFFKMAGAEKMSGANTQAMVFPEGVVKWSRAGALDGHYETNQDARFYRDIVEQFPEYRMYLAETVQIGRLFTVQEPIYMAHENIYQLDDDQRFDVYATLIQVAHALGIRDVHMGNWGFRGDDRTTPVIFDFSERKRMGSYMDWDCLNVEFMWDDWGLALNYEDLLREDLDNLNMNVEVHTNDTEY
jgi:hypothetical protein